MHAFSRSSSQPVLAATNCALIRSRQRDCTQGDSYAAKPPVGKAIPPTRRNCRPLSSVIGHHTALEQNTRAAPQTGGSLSAFGVGSQSSPGFFLARSCLGKVPGRAPFSQLVNGQLHVQVGCKLSIKLMKTN